MPDADAEKVSLEPDSISLMEALLASEHDETSVQNGFSPGDKDCSDTLNQDDDANSSAAPGQICPVELHKAVLLYPSLLPSDVLHTPEDLMSL